MAWESLKGVSQFVDPGLTVYASGGGSGVIVSISGEIRAGKGL
jgi:hypothetical protein